MSGEETDPFRGWICVSGEWQLFYATDEVITLAFLRAGVRTDEVWRHFKMGVGAFWVPLDQDPIAYLQLMIQRHGGIPG